MIGRLRSILKAHIDRNAAAGPKSTKPALRDREIIEFNTEEARLYQSPYLYQIWMFNRLRRCVGDKFVDSESIRRISLDVPRMLQNK
jgi:hypothetical protein